MLFPAYKPFAPKRARPGSSDATHGSFLVPAVTILYYTILYYTILYYTILFYTILY